MTYSAGGLIQATDYNNFNGGSGGGANVSGQLSTVFGIGNGNAGYGQTAIANVTATSTVAATQWTTLVNAVNTVRKHQNSGFTNIGTYTAGTTINATNDVSGNLTAAYTNRNAFGSQGSTGTGATNSPNWIVTNTTAAALYSFTRTATFANADAVRYFFNAGGQLNFVFGTPTNGDSTIRSSSIVNLINNFSSKKIGAQDAVAKTGTGNATVVTDLTTNNGYFTYTTANVTLSNVASAQTTYLGDNLIFYAKTSGVAGSNGDKGTVVSLSIDLYSGAQTGGFNDSINVTAPHRIDVIYPEQTFLANTWGSVTVA
jgi:hypothetical protein